MEIRNLYIYVIIPAILLITGATYEDILNDKRKQIDIYNTDIEGFRKAVSKYSNEQTVVKRQIDSLKSETESLDKFLSDYQNQQYLTPLEIAQETNIVLFLEEEIDNIQQSFRNKVVNLYKHGNNYELELLLSSKTPNEYLRRNQYLQRFSQNRKKELRELKTKKFILEEKKKLLTLSVSSQRFYVETRRAQRNELNESVKKFEQDFNNLNELADIESEKIKIRENNIAAIKSYISNLQENKETFQGAASPPRINYPSGNFEQLKGMLNIPLDFAVINSGFGEHINNLTGTKAFNNGIDFSIAKGSKVYAVSNGSVVLTGELPYYGKIVIIAHENGYRTVYAKLSHIDIKMGNTVRNNQLIGKTGENSEGQGLHFEIWKDKMVLNPEEWLKIK
jgi:murein DD-endopeptidase MepM/ murein hydrolase activator NlpD